MSPSIAIPKPTTRRSAKSSTTRTSSSSFSSSTASPGTYPASSYTARDPTTPHNHHHHHHLHHTNSGGMPSPSATSEISTSSSSSSSLLSPMATRSTAGNVVLTAKDKGKGKMVVPTPEQIAEEERLRWAASPFRRRPSLMGKELEATKHIVVDVGGPDAPRLISCVSSSQGFDWNSSIFLPRYLTGRYVDEQLEHRQDPIEDIFVSDEEARELLPQWS